MLGCEKCFCNGHENVQAGICDQNNGECYCLHHTEGQHCQNCQPGFFGNPRTSGHCYHQCQSKSIIENEPSGFLGCTGSEKNECMWIIKSMKPQSLIELKWDVHFANNDCKSTTNKVEVYDGLPNFLSQDGIKGSSIRKSNALGIFCLNDPHWRGTKLLGIIFFVRLKSHFTHV